MNIILEGPDNAGKSTLAKAISVATGLPIKEKEGKPSSFDAVLAKIHYYLTLDRMIIDRHPVISQLIYGTVVRKDPPVPSHFIDRFLMSRPLIIYCRCIHNRLSGHEASATDTPEHLAAIEDKYMLVLSNYDALAAQWATIWYSDYSDLDRVVSMVKGAVDHEH